MRVKETAKNPKNAEDAEMRKTRGPELRGARPSRVLAKASRLRGLPKTRPLRIVHRLLKASRRKFVPAGRRDQHPGRARSPELANPLPEIR